MVDTISLYYLLTDLPKNKLRIRYHKKIWSILIEKWYMRQNKIRDEDRTIIEKLFTY